MKSLYLTFSIIFLGLLQLIISLEASAILGFNTTLTRLKIWQYYNDNLNLLANDTCLKFKNISQHILKDPMIRSSKTVLMEEFKRNVTHFQDMYEIYRRYNLNNELMLIFANTAIEYYYREPIADPESLYILQLIRKLDYDEICDEYEAKFIEFILNDFLPKIEDLKNLMSKNEKEKWRNLFIWANDLNECEYYEYDCFYNYATQFEEYVLTPKEQLFSYIEKHIRTLRLFYGNNVIIMARGILRDKKLLKLPQDLRQTLQHNIVESLNKYEHSSQITEFYEFLPFFYENVLVQFYNNMNISYEERLLLHQIFNEHGYEKFELNYMKKINDFEDFGLFKKFKESLKPNELSKEKELLGLIKNIESLTSYDERTEAIKILFSKINEVLYYTK